MTMNSELENAALDYSKALLWFNYSTGDTNTHWHLAERFQEGVDQRAIDDLLKDKKERYLSLLRTESNADCLKEIVSKNMSNLENREVLVPILERYAQLCEPNILLYLLLSSLYWTCGEDLLANRYLDMAAEIDSDNLYVLRHRLLRTSNKQDQSFICKHILEKYPGDSVAVETMRRIECGINPSLSPRTGEHASIDFVLEKLACHDL